LRLRALAAKEYLSHPWATRRGSCPLTSKGFVSSDRPRRRRRLHRA
jgi:hypothetical protein